MFQETWVNLEYLGKMLPDFIDVLLKLTCQRSASLR